MLLWTTGRVVDATRETAPEFWRRYLALAVDGLRAASATPLPRPPLTPAKHRRGNARVHGAAPPHQALGSPQYVDSSRFSAGSQLGRP